MVRPPEEACRRTPSYPQILVIPQAQRNHNGQLGPRGGQEAPSLETLRPSRGSLHRTEAAVPIPAPGGAFRPVRAQGHRGTAPRSLDSTLR